MDKEANKKQRSLLTELCMRGKPLVEIHIVPEEGEDIFDLIKTINALAPDIEVGESSYNSIVRSGKYPNLKLTIEGDATKEALERLFGWKIYRAKLPKWNQGLGVYDGVCDDTFYWRELNSIQYFPSSLVGRVSSIGISQPGTNDNGDDDLVSYPVSDFC